MRLRNRFLLIAVGMMAFLIIAPILVFYARGFKYDLKTRSIVKTGTLVVDSQPDKASIWVNGQLEEKPTPLVKRFLAPGDYTIKIEKDNYQSWSKRLAVKPQLVTRANQSLNYVTLFLKQPLVEKTTLADSASLSRNRNAIAIATGGQLQILSTDNGAVQAAGNLTAPTTTLPIEWQDTNQIFYLNRLQLLSPKQVAQITRIEANGAWVALTLGNDLYVIADNQLILVEKQVVAFDLESDGLWYAQKNFLKRYNLNSSLAEIINSTLPAATSGQVIRSNSQLYLILDQSLYVLNDKLEKIYAPADRVSQNSASGLLLVSNSNELAVYNPLAKTTELILRSQTKLSQALLNSSTGYIFFANDGQLKAVELDGRDQRNAYTVLSNFPDGDKFTLSANGQILYVIRANEITEYQIW